jgi:hypothetical protein
MLLISLGRNGDALMCLKHALNIDSSKHYHSLSVFILIFIIAESIQPAYNYTLLLIKLGKKMEACNYWLELRGIPLNQTTQYYDQKLKYVLLLMICNSKCDN